MVEGPLSESLYYSIAEGHEEGVWYRVTYNPVLLPAF